MKEIKMYRSDDGKVTFDSKEKVEKYEKDLLDKELKEQEKKEIEESINKKIDELNELIEKYYKCDNYDYKKYGFRALPSLFGLFF